MLLGLIKPSNGRVHIGSTDLASLSRKELRVLRGRVPDGLPGSNRHAQPAADRRGHAHGFVRLLNLPPAEVEQRIDWALERVGLDRGLRSRRRHELSGGQAQRVGIARALVPDPEIVVFDEPTSALDATVQAQVLALIESLMNEQDRAYFFISHDLATIRTVADTVAVVCLGQRRGGRVRSNRSSPSHFIRTREACSPVSRVSKEVRSLGKRNFEPRSSSCRTSNMDATLRHVARSLSSDAGLNPRSSSSTNLATPRRVGACRSAWPRSAPEAHDDYATESA